MPALYPTWYRVNGDGRVDDRDVEKIVNIILGK